MEVAASKRRPAFSAYPTAVGLGAVSVFKGRNDDETMRREVTDAKQIAWITFPPERMEGFAHETHTHVFRDRSRLVITGKDKDVNKAVRKLEERARKAVIVKECKYKVRWVLGHDWSRAREWERQHHVRLSHWPHPDNKRLTCLKVIGSMEKIKEALAAIDFENVIVKKKEGKAEFGMLMTNHGGFRQRKYENATKTVIIFEKDQKANANGQTRYIIAGRREGVEAAAKTLEQVEAQVMRFPVEISFNLGRYIIGPQNVAHPRRLSIEERFTVTLHLEREDKDRCKNSLMIVAGVPENVENALAHMTERGPLMEICYEVDAPLWPKLVVEGSYQVVNDLEISTQTQISVGFPKNQECRCRNEASDPFEISISGQHDRVQDAWDAIKLQLAKEVGGSSVLEKMFRERCRFRADLPANTAASRNALPSTFIYPLVYWPSGARIRPRDLSDHDLELCQIGGERMCSPKCDDPSRDADARSGGPRAAPSRAQIAKKYKKPTAPPPHSTTSNAQPTVSNVHAHAPHMNATTSYAKDTAPNSICGATYAQTTAPNAKAPISYAQAAGSNKKPTVSYAQVAARNNKPTTNAASMDAPRK